VHGAARYGAVSLPPRAPGLAAGLRHPPGKSSHQQAAHFRPGSRGKGTGARAALPSLPQPWLHQKTEQWLVLAANYEVRVVKILMTRKAVLDNLVGLSTSKLKEHYDALAELWR